MYKGTDPKSAAVSRETILTFEKMTLKELQEEKKSALHFLRGLSSGSYLYELTMQELGHINRCMSDTFKILGY